MANVFVVFRSGAVGFIDWLDLRKRFITRVAQEFDAISIFPVRVAIFDAEPTD